MTKTIGYKLVVRFSRVSRDDEVEIDKLKSNIIGIGNLIVGGNFLKNSLSGRVVKITEKKK